MKYTIIIDSEDEQELNIDESKENEKDKLLKEDPFYKESEKKIIELIGKKRKMMQDDLLKELKMKMRNIDEECQREQNKLLTGILNEMKKEELLRDIKKQVKEKYEK